MDGERRLAKREVELGGRTVPERESFQTAMVKETTDYAIAQEKCQMKYPETFRELTEIIDSIDQKTLREVFTEYAIKSGVRPERLNFIENDHIYLLDSEDLMEKESIMEYRIQGNSITVKVPYFDTVLKGEDLLERVLGRSLFLRGLMHEYTHATGKVEAQEWVDQLRQKSMYRFTTGIDTDYASYGSKDPRIQALKSEDALYAQTRVFNLLNEGITERISYEVFLEYLRRTPAKSTGDGVIARFNIDENISDETSPYGAARHMLIALTSALAEEAGVPEDVVWRGFVRQYYTGEMRPLEMMELLNETFGSDFGRKLMNVKDGTDIKELAASFPKISAQYPHIIERWLEHLDIARGAK